VTEVRPLTAGDAGALGEFFRRIPEGDRTFFKEDVLDPATVEAWATDGRARRLVGLEGGDIVAYAAVLPGVGWSSHVGELRLVVVPDRRRRGIGRLLATRALVTAWELGLSKVFVEVVADQVAAAELFLSLGFEGEALLRDHVRDRQGVLRDLLVLSHRAAETWAAMGTAGIDDAVAGAP
jgi:L-amino acid N-acyltransferase YncA